MPTRSPIVSVLGHVDHGKSSLLDAIRGSNIVAGEAGAITQAIGASFVPLDAIKRHCGTLLSAIKTELTIPGLLFIDTPGHAAFTTLRKRGGTLADIAILVIDINEGFKPQTLEALHILREHKVPFIVAATKVDLVPGYHAGKGPLLEDLDRQSPAVQAAFDMRLYTLVGNFYEQAGMEADRFDRVDFTKQLAIVPCSAPQGLGIPELLMLLAGLAQRYLGPKLEIDSHGHAVGTILEVKEDKGLGTTIDAIIYDGTLRVNDTIIVPTKHGPIATKVRALLQPQPLQEMRDRKNTFQHIHEAVAAIGVKICAPDLEQVLPGMQFLSCPASETAEGIETCRAHMEELSIETTKHGVVIKADTTGSLEALIHLLSDADIPVARAGIGAVTKKDIADAEANGHIKPEFGAILCFNVPPGDASTSVAILRDAVIYRLVESYQQWAEATRQAAASGSLDNLVKPCKIEVLRNCTFRQSNPCIVGVEVLLGTLTTSTNLMRDGTPLGMVKSMQAEKESAQSAARGTQLAISIPGAVAGRTINEGDIIYSEIDEQTFRALKGLKALLRDDELQALKEIAGVMRAHQPLWGV